MTWTTGELARRCGGTLHGADDTAVSAVSTDTRSIGPGELFVAIAGENFDGHDFAIEAAGAGAAAVLVDRELPDCPAVRIVVDDTVQALGRLARHEREAFAGPVIAITGSNGKTTTKELCADMLAQAGNRVRRTRGNLNNEIGMPLSILALEEHDEVLVLELGMNHPGEIDRLAAIAQPDVGAITQVAPAHLGPMGSIEAIARAKGELLERLRSGGTAVLNVDDALVMAQRPRFAGRALGFGFGAQAEVRATAIDARADGTRFRLHTPLGERDVQLALPGCHIVQDALCALAAAYACGLLGDGDLDACVEAIEAFRGGAGRSAVSQLRSSRARVGASPCSATWASSATRRLHCTEKSGASPPRPGSAP